MRWCWPRLAAGQRVVTYVSAPGDLALHGVRVLGFPTASRIAVRFGPRLDTVGEALPDCGARGWARQQSCAGSSGWFLADTGRAENERRLAAELDRTGARRHRAWVDAPDRDA